jgi:hypothetical protein
MPAPTIDPTHIAISVHTENLRSGEELMISTSLGYFAPGDPPFRLHYAVLNDPMMAQNPENYT